jgi:hypothetical protein
MSMSMSNDKSCFEYLNSLSEVEREDVLIEVYNAYPYTDKYSTDVVFVESMNHSLIYNLRYNPRYILMNGSPKHGSCYMCMSVGYNMKLNGYYLDISTQIKFYRHVDISVMCSVIRKRKLSNLIYH